MNKIRTKVSEILRGWHPDPIAWLVALIGAAFFIALSVVQWKSFTVPSWDLGIFTQLMEKYSHLESPIVDIKGPGYNLWGDHFHPILIVLTPIFALFPSGLTLLIVQDLLFAWAAVPITRYARKRLGSTWGTVVGLAYIFSWGLSEAVQSQFHEIALAVPLLAFGLVFWLEGKLKPAYVLIGLLVFVKEDMGLTVAMFGIILVWLSWGKMARTHQDSSTAPLPMRTWATLKQAISSKDSTAGLAMFAWGMFWFAASILIILPLFNSGGSWDYTKNIGEGTEASSLIDTFVNIFGPGQKIVTIALLVIAMGIVGLRSPLAWLMVPTLAWRFVGNVEYYWGWQWHYSAILMPIAFIALVDGVDLLRANPRLRSSYKRKLASWAATLAFLGSFTMAINGPIGQLVQGNLSTDARAGQGAVDAVGHGRTVRTELGILAYLIPDNQVYWSGSIAQADFDTIAITPGTLEATGYTDAATWADESFGNSWSVVYSSEGYVVVKKDGTFKESELLEPEAAE